MRNLVTYCIFLCLWSFQHLCQSSHGTQITQKNVSYDDNVNKDKPGNGYTTMSSVNICYLYWNWGYSPPGGSFCKAKLKTDTFLYWHSFMPVMVRNVIFFFFDSVKWCLGFKIGCSLLHVGGLHPLFVQLHHSDMDKRDSVFIVVLSFKAP